MKTIGRVTSFDFCSKLITGNRLPNHCNRLHKAFLWKDVTLHNWIWISTFRYTGNRLPIYCNRLHHLKNNWNIANSVKSFWNQTLLLVIDYKKLVLRKFWEKLFWKTKLCYVCFLKNLFNTSLVKSSWFLLLNLEFIFSWILKSNFSWFLKLVDSILKSFSWAFCHHLCYHQNSLNQSWFIMKLASTMRNYKYLLTKFILFPCHMKYETWAPSMHWPWIIKDSKPSPSRDA